MAGQCIVVERSRFNMKRRTYLLLLLTIFCGLGATTSVQATAVSNNVQVILHKRMWQDETPAQTKNVGTEMDFGGQPLAGAKFAIYDVTKRYYEAEKQPSFSAKEYMNQWAQKSLDDLANEQLGQPVTTQETNESGEITLTLPAKTEGKDAVYLFVETALRTPNGWVADPKSNAPLLLILPVMDSVTNHPLSTIHLYPKNVFKTDPVVPDKPVTPDKETPVTPDKKGFLPHTGQAKSILSIIGLLIMGAVLISSGIKTKRNGENK